MSTPCEHIEIVADPQALARAGAQLLASRAQDAVQAHGRCAVALSGGSTPRALYALLAEEQPWRDAVPWPDVHWFWGDERNVPHSHADSNYRAAREVLMDKVPVPPANVHPIPATGGSAEQAARQYAQTLRSFFQLAAGQWPRFDLVLLGMGADGHTASLFPGSQALHEQESLVAAPWVDSLSAYRITLTPPVLNHAVTVAFLISGQDKAARLNEVLHGPRDIGRLPSQVLRPTDGELLWLVDRAAASQLSEGTG